MRWDILPNRALFEEIIERDYPRLEMLSVTINEGVIRQREYLAHRSRKDNSNVDRSAYKMVQPGDIVYNKMRAWQGAVGASEHKGIVSPAYVVVRPRKEADSHYFQYLLRTSAFSKEAERWSYGITSDMWSLRPEHFKMIYACLPPPPDQSAIVRFLDHADNRIQRYIRAKEKLIELLEEQKLSTIYQSVTGQIDVRTGQHYPVYKDSGVEWLGKVPAHWDTRRLKWTTRLQRGYDLPADSRVPGPYPVVSSGGVIDTHSKFKCSGPGVVMGRYGSTDAVFYVEQDFWPHNTSLFVTQFYDNCPKWCYYLLRSITKADHAGKSAVPGLDRKDLFQIVVPVPPPAEQLEMVRMIEASTTNVSGAISKVQQHIGSLREYRTRLTADVVTGKLDVRDAAPALPEVGPLTTDAEQVDHVAVNNRPEVGSQDVYT